MADLKRRIVAEFSAQNKAKGTMAGFRKDMDSTGQSMKRMAGQAMAMAGIGGGLYALKKGFDYITAAAMKQQDAVFLLEASLRSAGEYTTEMMEGFEEFAAAIQKATIYGDEEVLALMQLMKSLGVTSSKLEQATRMAIGLAAATGRDVKSMAMYIALAQQGEFTMLRRYIPALRSTTDATEQLRIITEFAARGFDIAKAKAETASGAFGQMWNAVSDLAEVMGRPFIDRMAKDAEKAKGVIEKITEALKKQKETVEELIKAEGRLKYMPIGVPFAAPRVPKDIYVRPENERLAEENKRRAELMAGGYLYKQKPGYVALEEEQVKAVISAERKKMQALEKTVDEEIKLLGRLDEPRQHARMLIRYEAAAMDEFAGNTEKASAATDVFRYKLEELERAQKWAEVAKTMEKSFAGALERLSQDWRNYGEYAKQVLREILLEMMRIMMWRPAAQAFAGWSQPALTGLMGGAMGFLGGDGGGMGTPPGGWDALRAKAGIPSGQHGGDVFKTGLAVIHKGERLSGVGKAEGVSTIRVEIHNEQGEDREVSRVEQYILSDQRIIDVFTRRAQTDGPLRRSVQQAVK